MRAIELRAKQQALLVDAHNVRNEIVDSLPAERVAELEQRFDAIMAEHDAIDARKFALGRIQVGNPAVEDDLEAWMRGERARLSRHAEVAKAMERTAQVSGAEICVGPGAFGEGLMIEMMGTMEQLRQAFYHLQMVQKLVTHQVRYHLYEQETIRDFVSGKKDGKLVKIMKETGVSLQLQSCPEDGEEQQQQEHQSCGVGSWPSDAAPLQCTMALTRHHGGVGADGAANSGRHGVRRGLWASRGQWALRDDCPTLHLRTAWSFTRVGRRSRLCTHCVDRSARLSQSAE